MPGQLPSIEDLLKNKAGSQSSANIQSSTDNSIKQKQSTSSQIVEGTSDKKIIVDGIGVPKKTTEKIQVSNSETEDLLTKKMKGLATQGVESEVEMEAKQLGVGYVALKGFPISPDALTLVPEVKARELKIIGFLFNGTEIRLGAVNPKDEKVKEILFQITERNKANGKLYMISEDSFNEAVKLYATLPKIRKVVKGIQIKQEELEDYQKKMKTFTDVGKVLSGASVTNILAIIIASSLKMKSSDIHIEAEENDIAVRLRIDGILQKVAEIDKSKWKKIISRIKLIAGLKLNIDDVPQDGRFTIFQKGKKIDVRTSTMPTAWGESVVMRILNPDSVQLGFEKLGFREPILKKLLVEIDKPHGMILTTGPTGSGKTTTLYAILQKLNKPGVNIITLEDPVEYKLKGINQSQIDHSKEYTFAKGLRSILRQDPDIVMVGEIRDLETADTAIQAALTGHMLISTIHTNDAAGAIPRFIAMGVKPFMLAPALNAVMGQRLTRRLCSDCKQETPLDVETLERVKKLIETIPENSGEVKPDVNNLKFYGPAPEGCPKCNGTGYGGRVGLYEILIKDAEIEKFILKGEVSEYEMREVAQNQGMITMAQDGILKALEGLTSIDEVKRITGL